MLAEACGEKRMGGGASREGAAGSSKAEDARFRRSRGAPLLVTSSQHSEESATEPAPRRLRLLCLHGYGANNDISALQLRHLQLEERLNVACDLIEASTLEVRPRYSCARATAAPALQLRRQRRPSALFFSPLPSERFPTDRPQRIAAQVPAQSPALEHFSEGPFMTWFDMPWEDRATATVSSLSGIGPRLLRSTGRRGGSLHESLCRIMRCVQANCQLFSVRFLNIFYCFFNFYFVFFKANC